MPITKDDLQEIKKDHRKLFLMALKSEAQITKETIAQVWAKAVHRILVKRNVCCKDGGTKCFLKLDFEKQKELTKNSVLSFEKFIGAMQSVIDSSPDPP